MKAETLEQIETRIAYLERANTELSDVVFRQRQELDALRAQFAALLARMGASQEEEEVTYTLEQERPPHY
ncbi:MAG TPA: SlyX family protein [Steroidobacteraceae bacterium]|jgi:SlyX protein|nr:SlyX family protein [Steroidobacteraceae bacterium]